MSTTRRSWSWDDPITPPMVVIAILSALIGAMLVVVAWVAS